MKPKTPIQKEVIRLSATLPELTNAQRTYAFHHCFKHYGRRTAKGVITCTECGHAWKSGHSLADTLCGCTCPNCGTALEITDTRKRVFVDNEYFSIITTCKGYQVIRFFFVRSRQKVGQKAEYSIFEVAQRWIAPDGKSETVARLRGFSLLYYDLWNEDSPWKSAGTTSIRCMTLTRYAPIHADGLSPKLSEMALTATCTAYCLTTSSRLSFRTAVRKHC